MGARSRREALSRGSLGSRTTDSAPDWDFKWERADRTGKIHWDETLCMHGDRTMIEGGCLCGAVRYRVEGEPLASGICHCRTCRRAASAPNLPFVGFTVSNFAIIRGNPVEFRSSPHVVRTFCGQCGSPLTYQDERHSDAIDIMTCSLDDPNVLPPTFSVWVSHKLAWDSPRGDLPAYDRSRTEPAG